MNKVWTVRLVDEIVGLTKPEGGVSVTLAHEDRRFTGPDAQQLALQCVRDNINTFVSLAWSVE